MNNHLTVLRKPLVTALEWVLIEGVPVVRRLKGPPGKFDWLRAEESDRFLAAVEKHYSQWRALFWTAIGTGLRRGELFALEWGDLDLETRMLTVRRSVFRGKLDSPKGGRQGTIPMTSGLVSVLRAHRAATMMRSAFVFPDETGELTTHQDSVPLSQVRAELLETLEGIERDRASRTERVWAPASFADFVALLPKMRSEIARWT